MLFLDCYCNCQDQVDFGNTIILFALWVAKGTKEKVLWRGAKFVLNKRNAKCLVVWA